MSRVFKAPNVQINNDNFLVKNTPVQFNQELKANSPLHRGSQFGDFEFKDINDDIDFGGADFEKSEEARINNVNEIEQEKQEKATDIIKQAEESADVIIEEAKIEAEKLKAESLEEGKQEGFNSGYEEGLVKAENEMNAKLQEELRKIEVEKENLETERAEVYTIVEKEAVEVIGAVLENLLENAFDFEDTLILQLVKLGLKKSTLTTDVNIKVANAYMEFLTENLDDIKATVGSNVNINLISDMALQEKECIIETDMGYIKCDANTIINSLKFNLQTLFNN